MATEIERKFLVASGAWQDGSPGTRLSQGYLSRGDGATVRVRLAGDHAWLTIKGPPDGISRAEYEYAIPPGDARELLTLCQPTIIDKTRHRIAHAGHIWEIDVFHGENDGLVLAEIELSAPDESFNIPPWLGVDVSDDPRYTNASLSQRPWSGFRAST